jgi:hypothetical protein
MADSNDHAARNADDERLSDEEIARLDRPLHEILGIEIDYQSEDLAPPIDEQRLLAFVRRQLSLRDRAEVIHLVASFRSWSDALRDLLKRGA